MSNETKRDVFERALDEWYSLVFAVGGQGEEAYGYCEFDGTISKYEKDYDDALPDNMKMSDEMKELRRQLINDCINSQKEGDMQVADGIKVALFEIDHLYQPYWGTDYSQGDGDDD